MMTIAKKLERARFDIEETYKAGLLDDTYYLPGSIKFTQMFYKRDFPAGYKLTIKTETAPSSLMEMFRLAGNVEKIKLDIPVATYNANTLAYKAEELREFEFPDGIKITNLTNGFNACSALMYIRGAIDLSEATTITSCVDGCNNLVDVSFVQESIKLSISFKSSSNLSDKSIESIVNGLATLPVESKQTLTVNEKVFEKMTEVQKTTITAKNWTLVSY